MDEKNTNKLKIKESFLKHGVLYFIVGLGLIVAYYCINHVPVIAAGVSKINNILYDRPTNRRSGSGRSGS